MAKKKHKNEKFKTGDLVHVSGHWNPAMTVLNVEDDLVRVVWFGNGEAQYDSFETMILVKADSSIYED